MSNQQTKEVRVKNHRKKRGNPIVTAIKKPSRKGHLNLSVSAQANDILEKARAKSGLSKSVLVQLAAIEYIAPKWLG